ncbi:Aste57867_13347 [Aphanomyces stellatus]|uniref:Aste57867_13347 protein n=1 Tax=Aphanomyces stellatus TaxID=120398 RepID=A0A485KXX1_9STRA|nr:hypothetical protein As57867_013297 [Aphanomyces stellatus]VFT90186.1 Aste57867_13347 [Aphanomyces stellatus]
MKRRHIWSRRLPPTQITMMASTSSAEPSPSSSSVVTPQKPFPPPPLVRKRSSVRKEDTLTTWEVVLHLLKGNIGAGALSLPYAFAKIGIYEGPCVYLLVVVICMYNMDLLLYCKKAVSPDTGVSFGEVAKRILGNRGKTVVNVFLVGTQLSFCCVYFTVVATNLRAVLPDKLAREFQERQIILLVFPIILALSWIRSLHSITPFSAFANCAVLLGISIVFYYSAIYVAAPTTATVAPVASSDFTWARLPAFYGTAVYSFEGIGLVLPLEKDMQEKGRFRGVLVTTMAFVVVLFLFLGEVPVLAFGTIDNGSMTAVLRQYFSGWPVALANVLLAIACLFSFPIQFYPAMEVLEKLLLRHGYLTPNIDAFAKSLPRPRRASDLKAAVSVPIPRIVDDALKTSQYEVRRTLFRSMLCTMLMLVAVCVPDVGLLISLFGAIGSSMLAVIIPPILYVNLNPSSLSPLSYGCHMTLVVFGTVGMVAGTIQACGDIANTFL